MMKLLIVNDEVRTADILQREIDWESYGMECALTAYDAESAKRLILQEKVDLLLCDIEMPGESGLSLLKWVREQKLELECIFLTCHANFGYAKEAIDLDCQDYILMPAPYEEIGRAVHKVADRIDQKRTANRYEEYGRAYLKEKTTRAEDEQDRKLTPEELYAEGCGYVLRNLGESELAVSSVAEYFHFHPVYLNRVFKQKSGIPLSQYIIQKRMELAADLLQEGKLSAAAIAEQVGYQYYESFHSAFKKTYDMTPAQYQEAKRHA